MLYDSGMDKGALYIEDTATQLGTTAAYLRELQEKYLVPPMHRDSTGKQVFYASDRVVLALMGVGWLSTDCLLPWPEALAIAGYGSFGIIYQSAS